MRAIWLGVLLLLCGAGAANAIGCLPGYVSIDCPPQGVTSSPQPGASGPQYPVATPTPPSAEQSEPYRQGIADWRDLKAWFDTQTGDRRAGIDYWAANRSIAGHRPCAEAATGDTVAFIAGCEEAKRRLDPIDARRRDSQYRAGFNDEAKRLPIGPPLAVPAPVSRTVAANPARVGPSFDCSKAATPLAQMICGSPTLSRIDVRFAQAFWALRQQLSPDLRQALQEEDLSFLNSVLLACGIPETGQISGSPDCVASHYNAQRDHWASRLTGVAAEEANRLPEQHLALQRDLQALGFLPSDARPDGAFGPRTRSAISAWQTARGRAATGFIGDDDARALSSEVAVRTVPEVTATATPTAPVTTSPQLGTSSASAGAAQGDEVSLKDFGGTFRVPVRINDTITLNFTVDSGASDVQIPADVVMTLMRAETVSFSDFIGSKTYTLADGSKLPSFTFTLRQLSVGNHRLQNVVASVGGAESSLLLGQSFLRRFKSWSFDNDRHVLVLVDR